MGGDLAQPYNDVDSATLLAAITNLTTDTSAAFWIGLVVSYYLFLKQMCAHKARPRLIQSLLGKIIVISKSNDELSAILSTRRLPQPQALKSEPKACIQPILARLSR